MAHLASGSNVSDNRVGEIDMTTSNDPANNCGASRCSSAHLPDIFVCFVYGNARPRRYIRLGKDNWDVHLWNDHWHFFDNVGDSSALDDFEDAWQKYEIVWPDEPAKSRWPVCVHCGGLDKCVCRSDGCGLV